VSDGNTNDSESDSKVDYNTKHVYFYLPKVPTEDGEVPDNIDLGAMLRLGGYCDLEQQAQNVPSDQQHYYPQKHIESQGAGSENIFKKSAGSNAESSHGILMACDGHFLLKAAEKMFVETGDHHLQVNGDYEHDTTGSVNVQSGDSMNLKTGTNKKLTLNAGDKTGDMELFANNKMETVQGDSTDNTTGDSTSNTSGNSNWFTKLFKTSFVGEDQPFRNAWWSDRSIDMGAPSLRRYSDKGLSGFRSRTGRNAVSGDRAQCGKCRLAIWL
jgi:hypothetical protein